MSARAYILRHPRHLGAAASFLQPGERNPRARCASSVSTPCQDSNHHLATAWSSAVISIIVPAHALSLRAPSRVLARAVQLLATLAHTAMHPWLHEGTADVAWWARAHACLLIAVHLEERGDTLSAFSARQALLAGIVRMAEAEARGCGAASGIAASLHPAIRAIAEDAQARMVAAACLDTCQHLMASGCTGQEPTVVTELEGMLAPHEHSSVEWELVDAVQANAALMGLCCKSTGDPKDARASQAASVRLTAQVLLHMMRAAKNL